MRLSIGIVGNCHIAGISKALWYYLSEPQVSIYHIVSVRSTPPVKLLADLRKHDLIISIPFGDEIYPGGSDALYAGLSTIQMIPYLVFTAFHPDATYAVIDAGAPGPVKVMSSPIGDNHSKLIYFGFKSGLTVEQTIRLFSKDVFSYLGYFDYWNESVSTAVELSDKIGYDIRRDLVEWTRYGCFMHTINHPKIYVIDSLTRRALQNAGLSMRPGRASELIADDLQNSTVWPVYPAVAEQFGINGNYLFKTPDCDVIHDLPEFVAKSFSIYEQNRKLRFSNSTVDPWLADPGKLAILHAMVK